ncbi:MULTISPECIES: hypothetical protein [Kitasatospora]|uniref:hypothetical protein n=1 Tax=Kitasatospora TaxID=2063 RepID=UPI000C278B4F|nr:hypothetical protein [Kitasatospora sp. CB02891]PJN21130.1 hypothetical protein CG736_34885 [Kitasatospora sp. CB02891]
MSLTSELRQPGSTISRWLARELPNVETLTDGYRNWASGLRRPVRPRAQGQINWPVLGHTIDHRIRVSVGSPHGLPIETGVRAFAGGTYGGPPPAVREALHLAGEAMLAELTARAAARPGLSPDGADTERLTRLCYLAGHYEVVYRSGEVEGLLADATADSTLESLLAAVPAYAVADIAAQLQLAADREALGWLPGRDVVCGPEFAGSDLVGAADADLIVDGELIDCKATVKPTNIGARELYQLAGYLLLDTDDRYGIRVLSFYLSRQGAHLGWSLQEFLGILGATKPLPELRRLLADELAVGARR